MRFPRWSRVASSILFLLLFLSTTAFGALLSLRTYQISSYNGFTSITGVVLEENGQPLDDVMVLCGSHSNRTGKDGHFILRGVPEGDIKVSFFKPSYVPMDLRWVAYPEMELDGPLDSSVNNISQHIDIILWGEGKVLRPMGRYSNGSLGLIIFKDRLELGSMGSVQISNGTRFKEHPLTNGTNTIMVTGNGTFHIRLGPNGPIYRSFHPVGHFLNITGMIVNLTGNITSTLGFQGNLCIHISGPERSGLVSVGVVKFGGGDAFPSWNISFENGSARMFDLSLPAGVYTLSFMGRGIIDSYYLDLNVTDEGTTHLNITLLEGTLIEKFRGLSVGNNYHMAALNIILGALFLLGAVVSFFNGGWVIMVILAFLGFVSNGIFQTSVDPNHMASLLLLIILMLVFKDERTRTRRSRRSIH